MDAIKRLLMFGRGGNTKVDIPIGGVYGVSPDGGMFNVHVGIGGPTVFSPHSL